jgi:hypothetical protein
LAEVSGRVTLKDGKPLPGPITVLFQPKVTEENLNPGPTSAGKTDADGCFRLEVDARQSGAVVGKHRVQFLPASDVANVPSTPETGSQDGYVPKASAKDFWIPTKYNHESTIEFDVPSSGTDKADFQLEIMKPARDGRSR